MRLTQVLVPCAAVLLLIGATRAQQTIFHWIPKSDAVNDVTPDGAVIVGNMEDPNDPLGSGGFIWRWRVDPQPTYIGGVQAVAVSADGTVVAGTIDDPMGSGDTVAGRWTQATGWVALPGGDSCSGTTTSARDISPDGQSIVGSSWQGCFGRGFRWTATGGFEQLGNLSTDPIPREAAAAISPTGHIAGWGTGNAGRGPALWGPDATGALYDPSYQGEMHNFSLDGTRILGESYDPSDPAYGVNFRAVVGDVFGPNAGDLELVGGTGRLNNTGTLWSAEALAMTIDGNRILGQDRAGLGADPWIWSKGLGMHSLDDWLVNLGATGSAWDASWNQYTVPLPSGTTLFAQGMNANGTVIVGKAFGGFLSPDMPGAGWIMEMPASPVVAIFPGCAGLNPAGSLEIVSGVPSVGKPTVFRIDNPLGTQVSGLAFLSLSGNTIIPNSFCGVPVPGFGMDATQGHVGELLVKVPVIKTKPVSGAPWSNGNPAQIAWTIPNDLSLLGLTFYTQGVILDFGVNLPALTQAALMFVGV